MPTLTEAQQQLEQAKQTISQREAEIEKRKKQLSKQRQTIQQQQFPRRSLEFQQQYGNVLRFKQKKEVFRQKKKQTLGQIKKAKTELTEFQEQKLEPYKEEVSQFESQIEKAQAEQARVSSYNRDLTIAKKWVNKGLPRSQLANKRQKEFYDEIKAGRETRQQTQPTYFADPKTGLGYSIAPELAPKSYVQISSPKELDQFKPQISKAPELKSQIPEKKETRTLQVFSAAGGGVRGVTETPFFKGATEFLTTKPKSLSEELKGTGKDPITKAVTGGLGGVKWVAFKPFEAFQTGAKEGVKEIPSDFLGGYPKATGEVATELIPTTPLQAGTYYGIGKAFKFAPKLTSTAFGVSGVRTIATAETPKERISGGIQLLPFTYGVGKKGVSFLKKQKSSPFEFQKPDKIDKTPLSKTFAEDITLFRKGEKLGEQFIIKKSSIQNLALRRFKEQQPKKTPEPIKFELDTSQFRNQLNRLRTDADFVFFSDKGISILEKKPRLRKKPRGKQLEVAEDKPLIKFDIKIDKDYFKQRGLLQEKKGTQQQKSRGQQQLLLKRPEQKVKQEIKQKEYQILDQKQIKKYKQRQKQIQKQYQKTRQKYFQEPKQKSLLKQKSKQKQLFALRFGEQQKQFPRVRLGLKTKQIERQRQPQKFLFAQPQILRQPQEEVLGLRELQKPKTRTIQVPRYELLPKRKKRLRFPKRKKKQKPFTKTSKSIFQKTKYAPSFTAVSLGIKGKKPSEIFGKSYAPTLRPILK